MEVSLNILIVLSLFHKPCTISKVSASLNVITFVIRCYYQSVSIVVFKWLAFYVNKRLIWNWQTFDVCSICFIDRAPEVIGPTKEYISLVQNGSMTLNCKIDGANTWSWKKTDACGNKTLTEGRFVVDTLNWEFLLITLIMLRHF